MKGGRGQVVRQFTLDWIKTCPIAGTALECTRVVQECKLHRHFEELHRLLAATEFMKITRVLTLLCRDEKNA